MEILVIDRLLTAINTHDLEALVACFAEDYQCDFPVHPARNFRGNAHVRKNWSQLFASVPDMHASVAGRAAMGDEVWSSVGGRLASRALGRGPVWCGLGRRQVGQLAERW